MCGVYMYTWYMYVSPSYGRHLLRHNYDNTLMVSCRCPSPVSTLDGRTLGRAVSHRGAAPLHRELTCMVNRSPFGRQRGFDTASGCSRSRYYIGMCRHPTVVRADAAWVPFLCLSGFAPGTRISSFLGFVSTFAPRE